MTLEKLGRLYIEKIVWLHRAPISTILDMDSHFIVHFWDSLHKALGPILKFSAAFHPHTNGQLERIIQILEDMLRACVIDMGGSGDRHLPLVEFTYNNSY